MKKILPFFLVLPFLGSVSAYASCSSWGDAQPLFSCIVKGNGKHLELCAYPNRGIEYSFGHSTVSPEMHFRISISESYYKHTFYPSAAGFELYLPHGNVTYALEYFWLARQDDTAKLRVFINHKLKATLQCLPDSINSNINEDILFSVSHEMNEGDRP